MAHHQPLNPNDPRIRSFSIACPAEVQKTAAGLHAPSTPTRRMSRALDVRPGKSDTGLWQWVQMHVDKQFIGLAINFLILIVLLMLLKVFAQWIQVAQLASREMRASKAADGVGGGGEM